MDNKNNLITAATWQGTIIDEIYGGTGQSSYTAGDMIYATNATTLAKLAASTGQAAVLLCTDGGFPLWSVYPALTVFTQIVDKTVANTVTETSLIGTGNGFLADMSNLPVISANYFKQGKTLSFQIRGYHSSSGNSTLTIRIKLGSTTLASGTITSGNGSQDGFNILGSLTCRSTGATGTIVCAGQLIELHSGGETIGLKSPGTPPAAVVVDTTVSYNFYVTAEWGAAAVGNTITSQIFLLESHN